MTSAQFVEPTRRTYRLKKVSSPPREETASLLPKKVREVPRTVNRRRPSPPRISPSILLQMDLGIVAAIVILIVWGVWTFAWSAPGWAHILLMIGLFLLIYRIVVRGTSGGGSRS